MDRRKFLRGNLLAGSVAVLAGGHVQAKKTVAAMATPPEIEGPFYPLVAQEDTDFDLTKIEGRSASALGQVVTITGQVKDLEGKPISGATVDLWQANAAGKYRHPHDSSKAKLDPNFQGWAVLKTDNNGQYTVKTIIPGAYPVSGEWTRPPHIHFKVSKLGYEGVTTQMYFPDHPLNTADRLLKRKSTREQALMTAKPIDGDSSSLQYNIYLLKL